MIKQKHNGNCFLIYDSIQELPVDRFFRFNLQIAMDAGIGGDMNSIIARNQELREWIGRGRKSEALQALSNMENAIMVAMSEITPLSNAFVCLVKSVNGEEVTDLSQGGMDRYLKEWGKKGLTWGKVKGWVNEAKKNFTYEVGQFFPEIGNGVQAVERASLLKRRTLAALQFIQGKIEEKAIRKYDDILIEFIRPNLYAGSEGVEVVRTNSFEDAIVVIRKELNIHDDMTAHQFLKHSQTVKQIMANRKKKK